MSKHWIVVGISGVTCGGKGTLVKELEKKYPKCEVIHQDDYFLPANDPRHEKLPSLDAINWEVMSSLDMDKLRKDVKDILKRPVSGNKNLLFIEGFLVLNDKFLSSISDIKLYFTLPLDECKRRRSSRFYIPADVPGYFDAIVWSEHLKSKKEAIELNPDMQFVDGLMATEVIFANLVKSIQKLF